MVLAPFAKVVITRGCEDEGRAAAGAIRPDHNNGASSCFALQFSHMDNGQRERCWCVCVLVRGGLLHNKCFHYNGSRTGKQQVVMEHNHFRCGLKEDRARLCCFSPHFFIESFIRERKKNRTTHKPKSNPNIHRCTDSFSKITHTEQRVRGVTVSSSALKQRKIENKQRKRN